MLTVHDPVTAGLSNGVTEESNVSWDMGYYYPYPSRYSWTRIIISAVTVTVIMLIIVLGNVLVIVAIVRDRHLNGLQNWFIASLAVSDLLVGLFIMPLTLTNELMGYWVFGRAMCEIWLSADVLLCTASILNLVLISLDRYWSITSAISYVRLRKRSMASGMIGAVWGLSALISLPSLIGWKRPQPSGPITAGHPRCVLSEDPGYVIYSTVGSFYIPLIVMILVYLKIYIAARKHARRSINRSSSLHNSQRIMKPNSDQITRHKTAAQPSASAYITSGNMLHAGLNRTVSQLSGSSRTQLISEAARSPTSEGAESAWDRVLHGKGWKTRGDALWDDRMQDGNECSIEIDTGLFEGVNCSEVSSEQHRQVVYSVNVNPRNSFISPPEIAMTLLSPSSMFPQSSVCDVIDSNKCVVRTKSTNNTCPVQYPGQINHTCPFCDARDVRLPEQPLQTDCKHYDNQLTGIRRRQKVVEIVEDKASENRSREVNSLCNHNQEHRRDNGTQLEHNDVSSLRHVPELLRYEASILGVETAEQSEVNLCEYEQQQQHKCYDVNEYMPLKNVLSYPERQQKQKYQQEGKQTDQKDENISYLPDLERVDQQGQKLTKQQRQKLSNISMSKLREHQGEQVNVNLTCQSCCELYKVTQTSNVATESNASNTEATNVSHRKDIFLTPSYYNLKPYHCTNTTNLIPGIILQPWVLEPGKTSKDSLVTLPASRRLERDNTMPITDPSRFKRRLSRARERRATLVLGIVMASFIGCWLPFFSIYPITLLMGAQIPPIVFAVIFWLGYCNSALNPIIYTIFNREFRCAFKRIIYRSSPVKF